MLKPSTLLNVNHRKILYARQTFSFALKSSMNRDNRRNTTNLKILATYYESDKLIPENQSSWKAWIGCGIKLRQQLKKRMERSKMKKRSEHLVDALNVGPHLVSSHRKVY